MSIIKTLKTKTTDNTEQNVFPRTVQEAVVIEPSTGKTLDTVLEELNEKIGNAVVGANTTYDLTRIGNTITLTGNDGSVDEFSIEDKFDKRGGTIADDTFAPLILENTGGVNAASVGFRNQNGILGYLGMTGEPNGDVYRYNSAASTLYKFLDEGNYTDYVVPKTGGEFNGNIKINGLTHSTTGLLVHVCNSGNGTVGYWHVATLTFTGTYSSAPIKLTFNERGNEGTITMVFGGVTTDPSLNHFRLFSTYQNTLNCYLYKSATSTWELYIQKSEAYGNLSITNFEFPYYQRNRMTWVWKNATITSVPSGATPAITSTLQVNIAGNAESTTNLKGKDGTLYPITVSNPTANTVVGRDANGHTFLNYINSNTSDNENPAISQIIVTNGSDNYYRKASITHLQDAMGLRYITKLYDGGQEQVYSYGTGGIYVSMGSTQNLTTNTFGSGNPGKATRLQGGVINLVSSQGKILSSNSISSYSDERIKSFTSDIETDYNKLVNLIDLINIKSFVFKNTKNNKLQIGLSAQEVERMAKEIDLDILKYGVIDIMYNFYVNTEQDEDAEYFVKFYAIDYSQIHMLSLLKLKDMKIKHNQKLTELENRIKELEGRIGGN